MPSDTKVNEVWITYDPDDGYEEYATEAEGRAALEALVEYHRDRAAADAMHESVHLVCLYRCERVARVKQTITAHKEDDTEQGEWCSERGFDYIVELSIEEIVDEVARRKLAPTLAELQDDCRRAGYGPDNFVALVKAYRSRNGSGLPDAISYVRRLLASGSTDVK